MEDIDNETHYNEVTTSKRYPSGRGKYVTKKSNPEEWAKKKGLKTIPEKKDSALTLGLEKDKTQPEKTVVVSAGEPTQGNQFQSLVKQFEESRQTDDGSTDDAAPTVVDENELDVSEDKNEGAFITGAMLLLLMDTFIPLIGTVGIKVLSKGKKKANVANLKLTEEEKAILLPLADAVSKDVLNGMTPMGAFALVSATIYLPKLLSEFSK